MAVQSVTTEKRDISYMEKQIHCSETDHNNPTELIVETVAALSNTPVEELPPLYEALDPDALDQLFDHGNTQALKIRFQYQGFQITLDSDGVATFEEKLTD